MSVAAFIDDPNWAKGLPEMVGAVHGRHLPAHEDCSPLSEEGAAAHLRCGGTLGAMAGYEERSGQIDMLRAIVRAFNNREHLMIEAGTGVGKSLAYLIPSILWSSLNDTTVIVSTATRNLQSQLIHADIPKALKVLDEEARQKFKVALLKGRNNYVCLREVGEFFSSGYWTMSEDEKEEMPRFIDWLMTTPDGDLDSYEDGLPRSLLVCPGEECGGRRCPFYSRCFVYRARKAAMEANLVVANHALVLADATNPGGGILPPYGRLVLDEAHNLEDVATEYMSQEFSMVALTRILNRLQRRGRGRRMRPGGVLSGIDHQLQKGILSDLAVAQKVGKLLKDASSLIVRVVNAAEEVVDVAERLLGPVKGKGVHELVRYRVQEIEGVRTRQFSAHGIFKTYEDEDWSEAALFDAQMRFEEVVSKLVVTLHDLRDTLNDSAPAGEFNYCADSAVQVGGVAESLIEFVNEANFVLSGAKETHAYWIEKVPQVKRAAYVRLVAAPLSVAEELHKCLYDVKDSVVLSSATLRVGNDFKYMIRRLGCKERFTSLVAASPFNYLEQALVLAEDYLPDPAVDMNGYAQALAGMMKDLFVKTAGRALVLFTSYEMMQRVAVQARGALSAAGFELIVQGEGMSREAMTRALKENGRVVLFGAQSFWEGVDVAGEALSCVILARLPFAQVGDPIVEARSEKIAREGGSAFRDYSLPEAVIRFRQGFGRLIRTRRDRGVVVITDPRLVTKSYGAVFRRSLPTSVHTVTDKNDLLGRVDAFFAG